MTPAVANLDHDTYVALARYEKASGTKLDINTMASISGIGYGAAWARFDKAKKAIAAESGNNESVASPAKKEATGKKRKATQSDDAGDDKEVQASKRKRGRPVKPTAASVEEDKANGEEVQPTVEKEGSKRKPGRPAKKNVDKDAPKQSGGGDGATEGIKQEDDVAA